MRKNNKKKLVLVFSILILFMSLFLIQSKAFDILDFEFQRNILLSDDSIILESQFNTRDSGFFNGTYPATYSFTVDTVGGNPSGWDIDESGGIVNVFAQTSGHKQILAMEDTDGGNTVEASVSFDGQTTGLVEFWVFGTNTGLPWHFRLMTGATRNINIRINSDKIQYFDGATWNDATGGGIADNIWYHFGIDFDVSPDTFDFYLYGILLDSSIPFESIGTSISKFSILSQIVDQSYGLFVDAVGFDWTLIGTEVIDFSGDIVGQEPIGWTIVNDITTSSKVIASFDGRDNVLQMIDGNSAGVSNVSYGFDNTFGVVERVRMDLAFSDLINPDETFIRFEENGNIIVSLKIDTTGNLFYDSGSGFFSIEGPLWLVDLFTSIFIIFHNSDNTFSIGFNETLFPASPFDYFNDSIDSVDTIRFSTSTGQPPTYSFYQDNIIVNYREYSEGINVVPLLEVDGFKEVDKFEYALTDIDTLAIIGGSDFGSWDEIDSGGHNSVNIIADDISSNNRRVNISTFNIGDVKGIKKTDFISTTGGFIQFSMGFEFIDFGGSISYNALTLASSDQVIIAGLQMYHNGSLGWIEDISEPSVILRNDLTTGVFYEIIFTLNYIIDVFVLELFIDGDFDNSYMRPLAFSGKNGLKEIFVRSHWVDNLATIYISYIGIYEDAISLSEEEGWLTFGTGGLTWNSRQHNIFNVISEGLSLVGMTRDPYDINIGTPFAFIDNFTQRFSNQTEVYNTIQDTFRIFGESLLIFYIREGGFDAISLSIEGAKLVEGINEYFLEMESQNIDDDESYFFVDTLNRLQFRHISNDSDLEFIQARFNVNDRNTNNTIFNFKAVRTSNAFAFFRLNFTETSQIFEITTSPVSRRILITQDKIIRDFVILITDNDNDIITGLTTGYITDISLEDLEGTEVSFTISNLFAMLIPLIIILIPTILIASLYSKSFIVPLFFLFSLILTITGIIPIWLFFVIAISLMSFAFLGREL